MLPQSADKYATGQPGPVATAYAQPAVEYPSASAYPQQNQGQYPTGDYPQPGAPYPSQHPVGDYPTGNYPSASYPTPSGQYATSDNHQAGTIQSQQPPAQYWNQQQPGPPDQGSYGQQQPPTGAWGQPVNTPVASGPGAGQNKMNNMAGASVAMVVGAVCCCICFCCIIPIIIGVSIAASGSDKSNSNSYATMEECYATVQTSRANSVLYINNVATTTVSYPLISRQFVSLRYDWYHTGCSDCYLYMGIIGNTRRPACEGTFASITQSYTLLFTRTLTARGCYQIYTRKKTGRSCYNGDVPFSGDIVGAIWLNATVG
mmetsp:Transcript_34005/g.34656  ORF Transcript_34005/g.34656 Transcript_34005/m.34656 type:complete len:317 (+) Transcript_34005:169-1119(+)